MRWCGSGAADDRDWCGPSVQLEDGWYGEEKTTPCLICFARFNYPSAPASPSNMVSCRQCWLYSRRTSRWRFILSIFPPLLDVGQVIFSGPIDRKRHKPSRYNIIQRFPIASTISQSTCKLWWENTPGRPTQFYTLFLHYGEYRIAFPSPASVMV